MAGCRKKLPALAGGLLCVYVTWSTLDAFLQTHYIDKAKRECSCILAKPNALHHPKVNDTPYLPLNASLNYQRRWVGFSDLVDVDCRKAFGPNVSNSLFPQAVARRFPPHILVDSQDCPFFLEKYGFLRYPRVSAEEESFPLSFILLFYKDIDQVLFLLRAIYRPHNVYCLSVDTKSSIEFLDAVRAVARCLPNVFVASKLENIVYAGFSRLMADIDCMQDLLLHPVQWKYALNIPGQQFPLRTNVELVRILKMYNGANDVEGIIGNRMLSIRFRWKHEYKLDNKTGEFRLMRTGTLNSPPPHGLEVVKGSAYGTFSREFVNFVVNDPVAKDFLEWSRTVSSPDEYFWATLHHSKTIEVPGGFKGQADQKPWLSTYASWGGRDPCATLHTRSVCIFSPEDLPILSERKELFANKFYITHHPAALHCLDEMLFNLTYFNVSRNLSFYQNLPFALTSSKT